MSKTSDHLQDRATNHRSPSPPSPFISWALTAQAALNRETATKIQPRAADIACGSGRHTRLARELGFAVTAIDRDVSGLSDQIHDDRDLELDVIEADLEMGSPFPLAGRRFNAVVVTNYLHRPILPDIVACVADDGILAYETFAIGNERHGRPSNPDFLLRPGELLAAVSGRLVPVRFDHVTTNGLNGELKCIQRIVAAGRDHDWLRTPPEL